MADRRGGGRKSGLTNYCIVGLYDTSRSGSGWFSLKVSAAFPDAAVVSVEGSVGHGNGKVGEVGRQTSAVKECVCH